MYIKSTPVSEISTTTIITAITTPNTTTLPYDADWIPFTDTEYLTTVTGGLSIFGAVFIFITHCLWKDIRSNSRRMLLYITVADLLVAICHIAGVWYIPTYGACITQAFLTVFAINSSTFWSAAMAIYLFIITSRREIQLAQRMMFWFHLICWFVPLTMACLALLFGKLGRSGFIGAAGWCWIQTYNNYGKTLSHNQLVLWMILTNFMWKVIAFGIIIILYTLLRLKLKEALEVYSNFRDPSERRTYEAAAESERKLMYVPVVYLFLYIWGLARFFVFVISSDSIFEERMKWLTAMQGVGDTSQGFTNFLFFCLLTKRFMKLLRKFCPFFKCFDNKMEVTDDILTEVSSTKNNSTLELNRGEREPFLKERKPNYEISHQ